MTPLSWPSAANSRTQASLTSQGWTSQYTWASRTRRAISWVTWEPKSRMRIFWCCISSGSQKPELRCGVRACLCYCRSICPVVGGFLGNLDIVHMAFADAGRGDLYKLGLVAHLFDGGTTTVTHAGTQATGHLEDDGNHGAFVGYTAFDAFGHQLVGLPITRGRFLEVAVGAALLHGPDGAHAAVTFVAAALEQ